VVGLAEVHDRDAVRTEGGTDRRRRGGLSGRDLDFYDGRDLLLGHGNVLLEISGRATVGRRSDSVPDRRGGRAADSFASCESSSSTGVSRPQMLTITLTLS